LNSDEEEEVGDARVKGLTALGWDGSREKSEDGEVVFGSPPTSPPCSPLSDMECKKG